MKVLKLFALGICFVLGACSNQSTSIVQTNEHGTQWSWDKGTIVVKTPERPAGQTSAIGLTVPKMEVVRVGFVGLGMRGPGAVERFTYIPGVQIVALCDYEQERAEKCQKFLQKASMPKAAVYSGEKGYEQLCKRDDIDLEYGTTGSIGRSNPRTRSIHSQSRPILGLLLEGWKKRQTGLAIGL